MCVAFSRARAQVMVLGTRAEIGSNALLASLCADAEDWKPAF